MKKSTEERLADIESGITRLTKMQGCVFKALLILHKQSLMSERSESAMTSLEASVEHVGQIVDHSYVLMFGSIAVLGISVSMHAMYYATQDLVFRVVSIGLGVLVLVLFIRAFGQTRLARSRSQETKKIYTQTIECLESAKKEAAAVDDDLAQALAEWKELTPDDLVSEPKSED